MLWIALVGLAAPVPREALATAAWVEPHRLVLDGDPTEWATGGADVADRPARAVRGARRPGRGRALVGAGGRGARALDRLERGRPGPRRHGARPGHRPRRDALVRGRQPRGLPQLRRPLERVGRGRLAGHARAELARAALGGLPPRRAGAARLARLARRLRRRRGRRGARGRRLPLRGAHPLVQLRRRASRGGERALLQLRPGRPRRRRPAPGDVARELRHLDRGERARPSGRSPRAPHARAAPSRCAGRAGARGRARAAPAPAAPGPGLSLRGRAADAPCLARAAGPAPGRARERAGRRRSARVRPAGPRQRRQPARPQAREPRGVLVGDRVRAARRLARTPRAGGAGGRRAGAALRPRRRARLPRPDGAPRPRGRAPARPSSAPRGAGSLSGPSSSRAPHRPIPPRSRPRRPRLRRPRWSRPRRSRRRPRLQPLRPPPCLAAAASSSPPATSASCASRSRWRSTPCT